MALQRKLAQWPHRRRVEIHARPPESVRAWISEAPPWIEVRTPGAAPDALLAKLDSGECDAILLAIELRAEQLIIDHREGRSLAT